MKQNIYKITVKNKIIEIFEIVFDKETDNELIKKIRNFAETSAQSTFRRSGMADKEHIKNIEIGKRAEEAFNFLAQSLGENVGEVIYANSIDEYDFILKNKYKIDIKSSTMKTKQNNYNLTEALGRFNFTVLEDQKHQDLIIQALYPSRDKYDRYYFTFYEFVNYVQKNGKKTYLKMNGNSGYYSLQPLIKGKPIIDIFKIN